jgi:hypothetical protein
MLAVILALKPTGKLLTEAVTGFVALTGRVIDCVMLTFPGNVVGQFVIVAESTLDVVNETDCVAGRFRMLAERTLEVRKVTD